jgi:hypothetical protein
VTERLLLVELAAVDRFHRSSVFPFMKGFATDAGVPVQWLRFGVRAATRYERREDGIGLDDDDLASLRCEVARFSPTVVVIGARPSLSLLGAIRETAPRARIGRLGWWSVDATAQELLIDIGERVRDWAELLGVPSSALREHPYWTDVTPDFGYVPANRAARLMHPLPFVLLGRECTYDRPLARNPHFEGIDLSGCVRRGGCSFCARMPNAPVPSVDFGQLARRQLDAVASTLPEDPGRLWIRIAGEPAFGRVVELARVCCESELPPADLLLDARASALVRRQGDLAAAAELLDGSGHRLHIALVGVESFSRIELERMNKGVTPLENLDAVLALLRLEEQYPRTFAFREHGGLSLITFTPWTTLDDLSTTLCLVRDSGLASMCGKMFTSRLRLEPDLPITALARRDGLVVDRYEDAALDTSARNLYEPEVPWRFRDPRLEPLCRVLVRLGTDTPLDDDDLAVRLTRSRDLASAAGWSELDLAVALVDLVRTRGDPAGDPFELLDVLDASRAVSPARRASAPEVWVRPGRGPGAKGRFRIDLLAALCREGIKPVAKVEPVRLADVEAIVAAIGLPVVRVRRRAGQTECYEVFFGRRQSDVERAVELNDLAETTRDPEAESRVLVELGLLLGYPECCVQAFVAGSHARERESYTWLQLARRMALGTTVPPAMNPWAGPMADQYVPCGLGCAESVRLAEDAMRVALALEDVASARHLERRMRSPWLVLLRGQMTAIELIPESPVGERFGFRSGSSSGDEWELAQAAEADEVVMDDERLVLLRRGRPHLDLTARAYVWWHERPLQAGLWTRVLALRDLTAAGDGPGAASRTLPPNLAVLRSGLEEALSAVTGQGHRFGGLEKWSLRTDAQGRLVLSLGQDPEVVELFVTDARESERHLFRIGPLAFSSPSGKPLDSRHRRAVVADLARHLKTRLRARLPSPRTGRTRHGTDAGG